LAANVEEPVMLPGELQLRDVGRVDLRERRVALIGVVAAVTTPFRISNRLCLHFGHAERTQESCGEAVLHFVSEQIRSEILTCDRSTGDAANEYSRSPRPRSGARADPRRAQGARSAPARPS